MPKLSLSMVVRNEAERLEACLRSVAGFVDEMVLLDTGSTDGTVALAERLGAVVQPCPGRAISRRPATRRCATCAATGCSCSTPTSSCWRRPGHPCGRLLAQPDLLLINLLRHERGAGQSPYSSVSRLFRRHPAIRWSGAYHAQVDDSVAGPPAAASPTGASPIADTPALVHDGYAPALLQRGNKRQRLRQAMEQELRLQPHDPYACAKLGSLEVSEGRLQRGIRLLRRGLQHCPAEAVPERYELLLHLAIALAAAGQGRRRRPLPPGPGPAPAGPGEPGRPAQPGRPAVRAGGPGRGGRALPPGLRHRP